MRLEKGAFCARTTVRTDNGARLRKVLVERHIQTYSAELRFGGVVWHGAFRGGSVDWRGADAMLR